MLPNLNGEFRLAADPELRFTPSGKAVANARIVASSRKKNEATNEWEDDKECWLNMTVWGAPAENLVESFTKGDLIVIMNGRLETRTFETREGEKRTAMDVTVDSFGPSLRYASAKITKTQRQDGQNQGSAASQGSSGGQAQSAPAEAVQDPWATPQQGDEPPF